MKRVLVTLAAGLLIGAVAPSSAELPAPTEEEKAAAVAKAAKDAAAKARSARALDNAQDHAVENYRRNKGSFSPRAPTAPKLRNNGASAPAAAPGADHARVNLPTENLTRKEAQRQMPTPGQANDHSSTGRETVRSGR